MIQCRNNRARCHSVWRMGAGNGGGAFVRKEDVIPTMLSR